MGELNRQLVHDSVLACADEDIAIGLDHGSIMSGRGAGTGHRRAVETVGQLKADSSVEVVVAEALEGHLNIADPQVGVTILEFLAILPQLRAAATTRRDTTIVFRKFQGKLKIAEIRS